MTSLSSRKGQRGSKSYLFKVIVLGNAQTGKTSIINRYIFQKFSADYRPTMSTDFSSTNMQINVSDNKTINIIFQVWDTVGNQPSSAQECISQNISCGINVPLTVSTVTPLQTMSKAFLKSSDACILVYDVTNAESFYALDDYFDIYCNALLSNVSNSNSDLNAQTLNFVLFGNKNDLLNENGKNREVTALQARNWCTTRMKNYKHINTKTYIPQKYQILFYEISAADMIAYANKESMIDKKSYSDISSAFIQLAKLCIAGNNLCGITAENVMEENEMSDCTFARDRSNVRDKIDTQNVCRVGRADLCFVM